MVAPGKVNHPLAPNPCWDGHPLAAAEHRRQMRMAAYRRSTGCSMWASTIRRAIPGSCAPACSGRVAGGCRAAGVTPHERQRVAPSSARTPSTAPPGEVADGAAPYTEADPVAVLVTFLATAGCYLVNGRSHAGFPHVWIGDTEHPPRIWPVLAGATADGRKGTADAIVRRILAAADQGFLNGNVESGLTSGSGLIERVRDPSGDDCAGEAPASRGD
jgi:hypothetical protein